MKIIKWTLTIMSCALLLFCNNLNINRINKVDLNFNKTIDVIDTIPPKVEGVKDLTITKGEEIDLLANINVIDNSKTYITIEGEYDLNKAGTYNLKYIVTDLNNNVIEKDFKLNVLEKRKVNNDSNDDINIKKENNKVENETKKEESEDYLSNSLSETTKENNSKVDNDYTFVKKTDDFFADNKQELINIIYTSINEGKDTFNFYCNYDLCASDLKIIAKDGTLTYIQDYIHPYNTLTKIYYQIADNNVTVKGTKRYSLSDINNIEDKVSLIIKENINENMSTNEKIKALHDYLINNTIYENSGKIEDRTAVGALINGKAICGGYTHTMAILLSKLNIPNHRITVIGNHTWNTVYVNGTWLHIDATWDDPVDASGNGKQYLRYDYFLINENQIRKIDIDGAHNFNKEFYIEA